MEGVDKTKEIAEKKVELEKAEKKLEELRSKYKNDEAFTKYESYRDNGIDLARLKTQEMRFLRKEMHMAFLRKMMKKCRRMLWKSWKNVDLHHI